MDQMDHISTRVFLVVILIGYASSLDEKPPIIKSIPTTFKTREHDLVMLPCLVENIGASYIRWLKDGDLVAENGRTFQENVIFHKNNSLEVSNVSELDSGQYTCQVIRPFGDPLIQHHGIEVQFPPSIVLKPDQREIEVELNHEVSVMCHVGGVPKPFVRWIFKGEEVSNKHQLIFFASKGSLSGEYTCVATNGVGNSAIGKVDIRVVYPPTVKAEKVWIHSAPRIQSVLTCEITGSPQPEVIWYFQGRLIPGNGLNLQVKQDSKYNLIIKWTKESDFGDYKCTASNKLGTVSETITLSGLPNTPFFKNTHQELHPNNAFLAWEVDSYTPVVQYKLYFRKYKPKGKPDNWTELFVPAESSPGGPIHTQMYSLSGLKPSTAYEASVVSKNKFGWSSYSNINIFATQGFDLDVISTTESDEGNTINDIYSDYVTKSDYSNQGNSTRSIYTLLVILLISTICS